MRISLEKLLTEKSFFDLPTATPLQRAIVRASDGRPIGDGLDDAAVSAHFGCDRSALGLVAPALVTIVAGVRGGKSLLAACAAVKGVLTADLSGLKVHEISRFSIVAPFIDNAEATYRLLTGHVMASPVLRKLVVGEPTVDTLSIRRPDGRVVDIVVVAASKGGTTLRSRWSCGFVLDEVALFGSEPNGAAINAEEILRSGETRLVPGAQGWLISSPYGPQGLLYELYKTSFGKPGRILVVHAPTLALNNVTVSREMVDAIRAREPDVAAREYDAAWIDAESSFFDGASIDRAMWEAPLERAAIPGARYVAAWDAATRGNSWTLVIGRNTEADGQPPKIEVALARQWTGSKSTPLKAEVVIKEIGELLRNYGVREVMCDQWSFDGLNALARQNGFSLHEWRHATRPDRVHEMYRGMSVLLSTERIVLTSNPVLKNDLKLVRKRATSSGVRIELPRTPDGRHTDFAPSLVLMCFFAERTPASNLSRVRSLIHSDPTTLGLPSSAMGMTLEQHLSYGPQERPWGDL